MFSSHPNPKQSLAALLCLLVISFGTTASFAPHTAQAATDAATISRITLLQQLLTQLINLQQQLAQLQAKDATGCFIPTRNLSYGMIGSDVAVLQKLFTQKPSLYGNVTITGLFDEPTQRAVEKFQKEYTTLKSGSPTTNGFGAVGAETISEFTRHCYDVNGDNEDDTTDTDTTADSVTISDIDLDTTSWEIDNDTTNELSFTVKNNNAKKESVSYTIEVKADNPSDSEPRKSSGSFTVEDHDDETITKNFSASDFDYGDYSVVITIHSSKGTDSDSEDFRTLEDGENDLKVQNLTFDSTWNTSETAENTIQFGIVNTFTEPLTVEYDIRVYDNDNDLVMTTSDDTEVRNRVSSGKSVSSYLDSDDFEPGTYRLEIEVDPDDEIDETDEDNNLIKQTFTINS